MHIEAAIKKNQMKIFERQERLALSTFVQFKAYNVLLSELLSLFATNVRPFFNCANFFYQIYFIALHLPRLLRKIKMQ